MRYKLAIMDFNARIIFLQWISDEFSDDLHVIDRHCIVVVIFGMTSHPSFFFNSGELRPGRFNMFSSPGERVAASLAVIYL